MAVGVSLSVAFFIFIATLNKVVLAAKTNHSTNQAKIGHSVSKFSATLLSMFISLAKPNMVLRPGNSFELQTQKP